MANLCTTLQALQQSILSDSDSETEQRRSRRYKGLLSAHTARHRGRSSSSDGSRKSVDSVYIPRPRYRKHCVERDIASRPPLSKERRDASESRAASRQSPVQNKVPSVSVKHTSEQSSVHSERISVADERSGSHNEWSSVHNEQLRVHNEQSCVLSERISFHTERNIHKEQSSVHNERNTFPSERISINGEGDSVHGERLSVHSELASVHSQQSSDERHLVNGVLRTQSLARSRGVDNNNVDIPAIGQRRKCGSRKRDMSSEDSRRDSADDRMKGDMCRDRGTSDESRKSSFDEVFIPKTNGCGPNCLSGPEYIRCRCCGRFKKPEPYRNMDRQPGNDSPQLKQSQKQNDSAKTYSEGPETNIIEDKPPPIPKRKPLKTTKPGTFQPTQILSNVSCENKPPKHITFREDTKENTSINTNGSIPRLDSKQSASTGGNGMFTECRSTVMTSRPASALGAMRSRGALPVLPSYEDIVGARGFGFRKTSEHNQRDRGNVYYERKNATQPVQPGLLWRSHSIDGIDRLRYMDGVPTNSAALSVSTDELDLSSKKPIQEFLV